jgi:di/tricarboxylate transporter
MSSQAWITLAILIVMFALLVWNKLPVWIVFMGTLTVMMTLELAPAANLLAGFGNTAVATVGALFVVAAGMYSTGAISLVSAQLIGLPKSLRSAQLKIFPPVAIGSAFLNNTPLVAMMIPVIQDLTRIAGLAGSLLFMPLSFVSLLGGASTLIGTSTNLIIAGLVSQAIASGSTVPGLQQISLFTPTPVGAPAAILGIAFLIFFGARLLPKAKTQAEEGAPKRLYKAEFQVSDESALVGKSIQEAGLAQAQGYKLIALETVSKTGDSNQEEHAPQKKPAKYKGLFHRISTSLRKSKTEEGAAPARGDGIDVTHFLQTGDILTFVADLEALPGLWTTIGLRPSIGYGIEKGRYRHRLVEVVVSPSHPAVGRTLGELPVRENPNYNAEIVAVSRDNQPPEGALRDFRIQAGDVGILEVEDNFFYENRNQFEFTLIRRLRGYQIQRTSRASIAIVITVAMVLLAAFGVMSMLNAALLAAGAMLLTGCISIRSAWRSIDFSTLLVLGVAIGMEAAITNSGLSAAIGNALSALAGDNAYVALTVVFFGAVIMTNLITNAAAASFMFPIALAIAGTLQVNFMPFVIILMLGTSYAFINPTGYQTNLMVMEPGGYKFGDFVKVGLPLTVLVGILAIFLAPLIYPF